jgi:hypothetical protein
MTRFFWTPWGGIQKRNPAVATNDSAEQSLITLLESLTSHQRLGYRGIRLVPDLGYQCGNLFHNAEQLLR